MIETTKGWDLQLLLAEDLRIVPTGHHQTLRTLWKTQKETLERSNIEVKYNGHSKHNYAAHLQACVRTHAHLAKNNVRKQSNVINRTYNNTRAHTSTFS